MENDERDVRAKNYTDMLHGNLKQEMVRVMHSLTGEKALKLFISLFFFFFFFFFLRFFFLLSLQKVFNHFLLFLQCTQRALQVEAREKEKERKTLAAEERERDQKKCEEAREWLLEKLGDLKQEVIGEITEVRVELHLSK
jgi:predicted membrane protein